jgi:hypothetical protein
MRGYTGCSLCLNRIFRFSSTGLTIRVLLFAKRCVRVRKLPHSMVLPGYLKMLCSLIILAVKRLFQYSKLSSRPAGYPPNPKPYRSLETCTKLPIRRPELRLTEFAYEFGAITGLTLGRQNLVMLDTWQAVRDLV